MVQATDFNAALRDDATTMNVATGSVVESPPDPTDFAFEFSRADIRTFERVDSDLVIILEDGSVTRINGYYDNAFDRALVFQQEVDTVTGTSGLFVGGLGLLGAGAAAAAAGAGGGGGGGGGPSVAITEDFGGADGVVSRAELASGLTISGTATPSAAVDVTIGRVTFSTTADSNGDWDVTFPPKAVPTGELDVLVNATASDGTGVASDLANISIDTLVNDLTLDELPEGGDGMVNAAEASDGVTLTGTVEPGATVAVVFDSVEYDAVVADDGTWTLDLPASAIPEGDGDAYKPDITATDAAGNSTTLTETFLIDTTLSTLEITQVPGGSDGVVNSDEAAAGVTVTGTVEPGSTVVVVFDGVEYPAAVDPDGNWLAPIPSSALPGSDGGEFFFDVRAVDAAGNEGSTGGSFIIDTVGSEIIIDNDAGGDDGVINGDEAGEGISLGGQVDPGSTVIVIFEEVEYPADVDEDGNWNVTIPPGDLPDGGGESFDIIIEVTDPAGNVTEETETFILDTALDDLSLDDIPGGADETVNISEGADGLILTGTVEPGAELTVTFETIVYDAVVDDAGNWTVEIPADAIPSSNGGTFDLIIDATDAAGNTDQIIEEFQIDNVAPDMPFISGFAGSTSSGFTDIAIPTPDDGATLSFHTSSGSNGTATLSPVVESSTGTGESEVALQQEVADLIISATDGAENTQSTYYVFDQGGQNTTTTMSNASFGDHNITAVNLDLEEVNLVLTEADVIALADNTDTLIVQGNADDTVTLLGATAQGSVTDGDGNAYTEYSLGDATIWIDEHIASGNIFT